MIRITSISNVNEQIFDETWLIVRSLKQPIKNTKQVKELSPTESLFFKYRKLYHNSEWNYKAFNTIYVDTFLKEVSNNKEALDLLNYLYKADKDGKSICLACFCPDETQCHRSIIAGLLQAVGVNVITDKRNADYSHYYSKYKEYKN